MDLENKSSSLQYEQPQHFRALILAPPRYLHIAFVSKPSDWTPFSLFCVGAADKNIEAALIAAVGALAGAALTGALEVQVFTSYIV